MRNYKSKNVHGKPELAGEQNLEGAKLEKVDNNIMSKMNEVYKLGESKANIYKGQYTPETLRVEIANFFDYCSDKELKATPPLLCLWLGITKQTLWDWKTDNGRYGEKSDLILKAHLLMESILQSNIDKYPTGSIFLLKTTHGHIEASKIDITSNGNTISSPEEVMDMVSKLGLNK